MHDLCTHLFLRVHLTQCFRKANLQIQHQCASRCTNTFCPTAYPHHSPPPRNLPRLNLNLPTYPLPYTHNPPRRPSPILPPSTEHSNPNRLFRHIPHAKNITRRTKRRIKIDFAIPHVPARRVGGVGRPGARGGCGGEGGGHEVGGGDAFGDGGVGGGGVGGGGAVAFGFCCEI